MILILITISDSGDDWKCKTKKVPRIIGHGQRPIFPVTLIIQYTGNETQKAQKLANDVGSAFFLQRLKLFKRGKQKMVKCISR